MKASWPGLCLIIFTAALVSGQRRGDVPPALVWDSLKGNCPAHLDWASLRGNVVVVSFAADVFPDEIAEWNETLQRFRGQPALFFQIAHDSEFLLDQALKRTAYSGCLLFDTSQANRRNFKLPNLPKTVVVDQSGYIAGYTTYDPDKQAIQRLLNHEAETGLNEEPPKARPLFPDAARDIPPSSNVHISPAAKDEMRIIEYMPEPDLYITKNQPLKIIIVGLWDTPPARISFPENLDEGNYDITARIPAADSKLTQTLVREAVEKRFGLRIETETRTVRAYVMTALHSSPQLKPSSPQDRNMTGGSETSLIGTNQTMGDIARQFQDLLKTPVVDETGVEGKYNYSAFSTLPQPDVVLDFAHQLGLELTPAARPVEMLIVHSVVP